MRALTAAALLVLLALVAASCSINAGSENGPARLLVTRDFGERKVLSATEDPIESGETAMRLLIRFSKGDVKTRYGGRFVNAVKGIASKNDGGRRRDWFYYVNGIEAEVGAAERKVEGNDRVWWDYHDWTGAMRVPAVVGSFPEPFLHGTEGKRYPIRIDCGQDDASACRDVADKLEAAGIAPSTSAIGAPAGKEVLRLVVGKWSEVRQDAASEQIEQGPGKSGVFARFGAAGGGAYELDLLDPRRARFARSAPARASSRRPGSRTRRPPGWSRARTPPGSRGRCALLDERTLALALRARHCRRSADPAAARGEDP